MQPDNAPESIATTKYLESTGEYLFGLTYSDPHFIPVLFNSYSNFGHEQDYHSFVRDIACGRWVISQLRGYLLGTLFY